MMIPSIVATPMVMVTPVIVAVTAAREQASESHD